VSTEIYCIFTINRLSVDAVHSHLLEVNYDFISLLKRRYSKRYIFGGLTTKNFVCISLLPIPATYLDHFLMFKL
jgi:hypothetical protein